MTRKLLAIGLLCMMTACNRAGVRQEVPQSLVIAQQREPLSLNPALENGQSSTELGLLFFQYLVKWNDRGELIGDAAESVPSLANHGISTDGRTITYHLRPGLRFSDGLPLTARDCVWSIQAVLNPANDVQTRYGYDRVAKAVAIGDRTLVLRLREPFAPILTLVLAPQGFPILPMHVLARYPNFNHIAFDSEPIGSGPFVVASWTRNDRIEMRANPFYAGGEPAIHRMAIAFVNDPDTAINLLRTGEISGFFNDEDKGNYPILRTVPGVRATSVRINGVGAIIFNTQDPITRDPRVRHALAEALDIPSIVAKTYRGAVSSEGAARGLFLWAYDPKAYPDIPYDPAHARSLLEQAGWHTASGGVRYRYGKPLELLLAIQAQTPGDAILANVITQAERNIGALVTIKQFNETQFVAPANLGGPVYGGNFQMALYPFVNGDDPDTTDQFSCNRIPPKGYNKARFCDPQVDALLTAGRQTFDVARRKVIYSRLQARLYEELPIALIYQQRQVNAFTQRLRGQTTSLSGAFWNVAAWRLAR